MQETIPNKELSSEYYYLWKRYPQTKSEKKKYEQNEISIFHSCQWKRERKPSSFVEDNADMRTYICSILKNNYQLKSTERCKLFT